MLKTAIMIPVFEYTEEEQELLKLDIIEGGETGFEKTQERAFWVIESAYDYDEGLGYGAFYSGGNSFVSPLSKEELINLIDNHNK